MNKKDFKGIIALAAVTVLAFGLIWGSAALTGGRTAEETGSSGTDGRQEKIAVEGYEDIRKAVRNDSDSGPAESDSQMEPDWSGLRDGVYQASEDAYSDGFLNTVTITVSGSAVTSGISRVCEYQLNETDGGNEEENG